MIYLQRLLNDKEIRDRLSLLGQREVFTKHTYTHRLESIFDRAGLAYKKSSLPGVMIIATLSKRSNIEQIIDNFHRQKYPQKELLLLSNLRDLIHEEWPEKTNMKIIYLDEKNSMEKPINYILSRKGCDYEFEAGYKKMGGVFSIIMLNEKTGQISGANNLTRIEPVYWANSPDFAVIGNRALTVHLLQFRTILLLIIYVFSPSDVFWV